MFFVRLVSLAFVVLTIIGPSPAMGDPKSDQDKVDKQAGRADLVACSEAGEVRFRKSKKCAERGNSSGVARGDFNGDNFADLAIGVPLREVIRLTPGAVAGTFLQVPVKNAGAVVVIYGSSNGLVAEGGVRPAQIWNQNSANILDEAEENDQFGAAIAAGEFNGDNFSDLAIGAPNEDSATGAVHVLYGSSAGLTATGNLIFKQFQADNLLLLYPNTNFGDSLTWGDFDGNGIGDLAIGMPSYDLKPLEFGQQEIANSGAVAVLFGRSNRTFSGPIFFLQNSVQSLFDTQAGLVRRVGGGADVGNRYGQTLTAGNFDGDQFMDLAIGSPFETFVRSDGTRLNTAGNVQILYGSPFGPRFDSKSQTFTQDTPGILGDVQSGDLFGGALAAGDMDGNGISDLAIGVQGEDINGVNSAGAVNVLYGTSTGLTNVGDAYIHQGLPELNDTPGFADSFGIAVAIGDFNGDALGDLAIGVPFRDSGTQSATGGVHILYTNPATGKPFGGGHQLWTQALRDVLGDAEAEDAFGRQLSSWNFGRGAAADLAVGVPGDAINAFLKPGAVSVLYGSSSGLTVTGNQLWTMDSPGVPENAANGDAFGKALY